MLSLAARQKMWASAHINARCGVKPLHLNRWLLALHCLLATQYTHTQLHTPRRQALEQPATAAHCLLASCELHSAQASQLRCPCYLEELPCVAACSQHQRGNTRQKRLQPPPRVLLLVHDTHTFAMDRHPAGQIATQEKGQHWYALRPCV
eukprot:GHRQ01027128.1.p1 GENE.GHRQ01027128.1~~GHRQ01027128.1.p1  ORF type:complete len:150 (+),score=13.68 GHRQ01027128.1:193-642(+)